MNKDVYRLLAGKGEGNDSELAFVDGKLSHVTKGEHEMIKEKGKLGELFTALFGSGKINENTGLPGYDLKKNIIGKTKKDKNSPHNKAHSLFWDTNGQQGVHDPSHKTKAEMEIEFNQEKTTDEGKDLLNPEGEDVGKTTGELNLGQTLYSAEDYKGMTPEEMVDDIFAKQYNSQVPPDFDGGAGAFKVELAARLKNMPQFQGVSDEEKGFAREGFKEDTYGISKDAGKAGELAQQAYGSGMGSQFRTAYGAQKDVAQQFTFAEQGLEEDIYGLEKKADTDWESDFTSFLGTLPSAA